jgi:hypothetical protein
LLFFDNFPINSSFCSQLLTKEEWYTTIEYYIHIYSQKSSWFTSLHAMGVSVEKSVRASQAAINYVPLLWKNQKPKQQRPHTSQTEPTHLAIPLIEPQQLQNN